MKRRKRIAHAARYRDGVDWIALNDNAGDDDPARDGRDGTAQAATRERIAGYISTLLLADLFGADPDVVAFDIYRRRARVLHQPVAPRPTATD